MQESCICNNCNYHITICDITHFYWIVENEDIQHDENDVISIQVWISKIQQDGGSTILKDKLDPTPLKSGLSPEIFVLCIQTKFQVEQFKKLGSDFISIDATHNTTEYAGLNLFTIAVRDKAGDIRNGQP